MARRKAGPVPLTLEEALRNGKVQVRETGNVNSLEIENLGDQPVFVQAGDIVKGGKQDRTLTVSLLLPPKSGRMPIASFCVEHGRWSPRAAEDASKFDSAAAVVPSHEMKLAMQAPVPAAAPDRPAQRGRHPPAARSGTASPDPASAHRHARRRRCARRYRQSSLQLALENEKLLAARDAIRQGAEGRGRAGRHRRLSCSRSTASSTAATSIRRTRCSQDVDEAARRQRHRGRQLAQPAGRRSADDATVDDFLAKADAGKASEQPLKFGMARVLNDADAGYRVEARVAQGWVHRSYLAK